MANLIGTSQTDIDLVRGVDAEAFHRHFPPISLYRIDRRSTVINLYGEPRAVTSVETPPTTGQPTFQSPVTIPIRIIIEPPMEELKKFGIEQKIDALAVFSDKILVDRGISPRIGDHLEAYGIRFELLTVSFSDYFGNTQIPLHRFSRMKNLNKR